MADSIESVVLKVALEIENARLQRLDTRLAMQSIEEIEQRWEQLEKRVERPLQISTQGGAASASPSLADSSGGGLIQRRGVENNVEMARSLEEVERGFSRTAQASQRFNSSQGQTFLFMQRTRGEVDRMLESMKQQERQATATAKANINVGESLERVSTFAATAVVGYVALTQVNGRHVNILGEWEGRLQAAAIGTSIFARGLGSGIKLLQGFGIAVSASGAALAALPLAAAVIGFRELAKAKAEAARQAEIGAALDAKAAALNEARRMREQAAEKAHVDAMIGFRQRLRESLLTRQERGLDARSQQIALTSDPFQRLQELEQQGGDINKRLREGRLNTRAAEASSQGITALFGFGSEFRVAQLEQLKEANREIELLTRKQLENTREQESAVAELAAQRRRDLETLLSREEQEERIANLPLHERAKRQSSGIGIPSVREQREFAEAESRLAQSGVDVAGLKSPAIVNEAIAQFEQQSKATQEQLISQQKRQIGLLVGAKNSVDESTAAIESLKDALQAQKETMREAARIAREGSEEADRLLHEERERIRALENAASHRSNPNNFGFGISM